MYSPADNSAERPALGSALPKKFSPDRPSGDDRDNMRRIMPQRAPVSDRPFQVLLVEDNPHNAKLMMIYLQKLGYAPTWAQDGEEMWAILGQQQPDLILMDIHLPKVDGLELMQQLRRDGRFQTTPVIAQTAMAMRGDREVCLEAGASDYISKPIDLKVLAEMLATSLSRPFETHLEAHHIAPPLETRAAS